MELNKIYNLDCIEFLKSVSTKSVDIIITDPPYNINLKPQRKKTKSIENDNLPKKDFILFLNKVFKEIKRILKDNKFLFIFCGWSTIPEFREVLDKYFKLKSMPIWVKNNFGIGYYTRPQYEPCLFYFKGEPKPLKNPVSDVWKFNKVSKPIHSCEKPISLIKFIIKNFSNKNDIVLDPFMGSGSTAIAAHHLKRQYIGSEINTKYCEIINKRLLNTKEFNYWEKF